jgi:transcription elongation factor Elf1
MSKNREKYFRCPKCGQLTTKTAILEECSNGGQGMCYCQFDNGRILIQYDEITKEEYEARQKEILKK